MSPVADAGIQTRAPAGPAATPIVARTDTAASAQPGADAEVHPIAASGTDAASQPGPASGPDGSVDGANVLFARQSPILSVETLGPKRIAVGKQSTYEVSIQNAGQVAADQVVVTVDLPGWADVVGTDASSGSTESIPPSADAPGRLLWKVGHLDAKGSERLVLRILPRESRPFDLKVQWDDTPTESQAAIEVQEPKLAMELQGPREVVYAKPEVYRLEITNTGNGNAENVVLSLFPMGPNQSPPASHPIGILAAGEKKAVEVELTARHTGTLTIKVDAQADNGVEAHLAENILVRRAGLAVAVEAPAVQYVGTEATYRLRVSNPGNAPAKNVQATATLPAELKYVSSVQGGQPDSDRKKVTWTLESLSPGGETVLLLTCNLHAAGSGRVNVLVKADDDLAASAEATTQIEAMADLTLSVSDPSGPVPVGQEAAYELHIQNRGSKDAEHVEVVVYFSHGIEPVAAEGGRNRLGPGQVVFEAIPSVTAGQNLMLKIRARADAPGNHICRAEVHCKALGTRLVSEETTHFYSVAGAPPGASPPAAESQGTQPDEPGRTADRRKPITPAADQEPSTSPPLAK
ncbi:MAG: DUF11 domain-containing protein [Pirellulales bacterium]|nr:DUF11 domain-containing protein [Pirellulales bacterium]